MQIKVRKHSDGKYKECIIVDGNASIDVGTLTLAEQKDLAMIFLDAARDLLEGLEDRLK